MASHTSASDSVEASDRPVVGVPFDSGTSYRPGARFGPAAVRQGSRLLRPWHTALDVAPLTAQQVADAGDIACNPFDIKEAVDQIEAGAAALLGDADHLLAIGGDHTIAYPLLPVTRRKFGPVALVHFDAHLDTWQTYFGAPITHGTPFRRAAEEGLFLDDASRARLRPRRDDHCRRRSRLLRTAGPDAARPLTPRPVRSIHFLWNGAWRVP
jgi:agmatinase